jgi:putative ATPase
MTTLFAKTLPMTAPLAERLRPQTLSEVVGQHHLLKGSGLLHRILEGSQLPSLILAGPPGCGKTTLARLLAEYFSRSFVQLSAVFAGVADLRKVYDEATRLGGIVLFVDEIHHFNKSQQDALLGPIENGLITLIGATTENPSFALNNALLSRCQVLLLQSLDAEALAQLLQRAEQALGNSLPLTPEARIALIDQVDGDGRMLLNYVELLSQHSQQELMTPEQLSSYLQRRSVQYDRAGEYHYNCISAMIKSLRGSDPDAALYWMARMLAAGEDPLYLTRRLIRFATEDIGLADPQALTHAIAAEQAYQRLGSPEGDLAVANSVVYLATAPKSNAVYTAFKKVMVTAEQSPSAMPPSHIINAPTKLMKQQGYGKGYIYDHDTVEAFSGQNYFPETMKTRPRYYQPVERGFEREIRKRLDYWEKLRQKKQDDFNEPE